MRLNSLSLLAALCLTACGGADPVETEATFEPDPRAIEDHMAFLASDVLLGREAGTPGYDAAALYAAAQFDRLGLAPAGEEDSFFQTVPLLRSYRVEDDSDMSVTTENGTAIAWEKNVDYAIGASVGAEQSSIEAEAVFVGFGIVAPKEGRDDYEGVDLDGKIAVMLSGTPPGIQTEERAFYGSRKSSEAAKRGAIGVVQLETPTRREIFSFKRLVGEGRLDQARMGWLTPEGEAFSRARGIQASARVSLEGAPKLFEGAEMSFEEVIAAAEAEPGTIPAFDLPVRISITQTSEHDTVASDNVIAVLEGADPALKDEYIVLVAHLDHIGVTPGFTGDRINNGALDNAAGVATLLDAARMLSEGEPPRRSVLFLLVTAEEKGLLGAQYFTENPTVPVESIVGVVNLDMPVLTYEFEDLVVFGGTRSTIEAAIGEAVSTMDIAISPDPFPEQGLFTRSDHFRFVEIGVPSVFLATGFANGGEAAWATHFAEDYHRPSDDMQNDLSFDAAARFAEVNARIAAMLANADDRPLWRNGDFFAQQFDGPEEDE